MITPISLESEIEVVRSQLERARGVGAKKFHIDIIDGLFADNVTIAPADLQGENLSELDIDLHLLVDDPTEWIPECVALKPKRLIAQIEKMGNIEHFVAAAREHKEVKVLLGVGLHTSSEELSHETLKNIDGVLLMAIEPGFGGSPFHSQVLEKIKVLRKRYEGEIIIDGGIKPETYRQVLLAGASEAGANSGLWVGNFEENWENYKKIEEEIYG